MQYSGNHTICYIKKNMAVFFKRFSRNFYFEEASVLRRIKKSVNYEEIDLGPEKIYVTQRK